MDLKNHYHINLVSALNFQGSFIVALKRNDEDLSLSYENYKKCINNFKTEMMADWFESLGYAKTEYVGEVVLVRIGQNTNNWARGIINNYISYRSSPEIYLIDTQTFMDKNTPYLLRECPQKLVQLKLPTYTIHTDINLNANNDDLKNAINMMIDQNQNDKLNIIFTPQSVQNNDYSGLITVNSIPLKKYLKVLIKKYCSKKDYKLPTVFNPLSFKNLKNIFIPRHLPNNSIYLDENEVINCSVFYENASSSVFLDEPSKSTTDYYGNLSDDSKLNIQNSKDSQNTPNSGKLNIDSSGSFDLEHNLPKCLPVNRSTDESKSENTEKCFKSTMLKLIENTSEVVNKTSIIEDQDCDRLKQVFKTLMKKRVRILKEKEKECQQNKITTEILKLKDKECVQNTNTTETSKKTPSISLSNDYLCWLDDDFDN